MIKNLGISLLASCFFAINAYATKADSNIVIASARVDYNFEYNRKSNQVNIQQQSTTTYLCNSYRTTIPITEFYDDRSSIDEVKIYVNGSKARDIIPEYSY